MGNSIGESTIFTVTGGRSIQLSADGAPKYKAGGVTIDWDYVPAVAVDTTFEDNVVVAAGTKALRYGSVVYRLSGGKYGLADGSTTLTRGEVYLVNETWLEEDVKSNHPGVIDGGRVFKDRVFAGITAVNEVQRLTVTATGGTFVLMFTYGGVTKATAPIAYNASGATATAALEALSNIGTGNVVVTKSSADFIVTFGGTLAGTDVPSLVVDGSLATGGTVVQSVTTAGVKSTPTFANLNAAMPGIVYAID